MICLSVYRKAVPFRHGFFDRADFLFFVSLRGKAGRIKKPEPSLSLGK